MKNSAAPQIKPMTVTGEYITRQAFITCCASGLDEARKFLQSLIPNITPAQCEMICRRKARLTGVSPTVNYEEVTANENQ